MPPSKAMIVDFNVVTPYGWGIAPCWEALMAGESAIQRIDRFDTTLFRSDNAALVPGLERMPDTSLVMQMLEPLLAKFSRETVVNLFVILATTTGEIDYLEDAVLNGRQCGHQSRPFMLLRKLISLCGAEDGMVVSAACASSSAALARAAALIRNNEQGAVLVVACDAVSEFVMAGFSALMALDRDRARPFDARRTGLSLGEAAGYVLLMGHERAEAERRACLGEVAGWAVTSDANHITGPSRDGGGLALAVQKALDTAGVPASGIDCIGAHGTGTVFNDAMEMKAFKQVFPSGPVPLYAIKGGTGHTMGAAGLLEAVVALHSLRENVVPPTVNLHHPDTDAAGWVSTRAITKNLETTLSTNSGFGGVNCALILKR